MSELSILFVDDEENVLKAIRRQLHGQFDMLFAVGAENALNILNQGEEKIAVIVSDLRMPKMDGFAFLKRARALSPNAIQLVLTGNADVSNAIKAVNEGTIFRFLTKPCETKNLVKTLNMALEQYKLITAEKELLEKTLRGCIEILTDLLSLTNPEAFGRSSHVKELVMRIGRQIGVSEIWQLETAAMLSQIGWITLPRDLMTKIAEDEPLDENESQALMMHPMIASDLLDSIPRMEEVSRIVAYQEKHYDGGGFPRDGVQNSQIPLGARILKAALDYDRKACDKASPEEILLEMENNGGVYDPNVLKAMETIFGVTHPTRQLKVGLDELNESMVIEEDIKSAKGKLVIPRGQRVSQVMIKRLTNFTRVTPIALPIKVRIVDS